MPPSETETEAAYLLRRAKEETYLALTAGQPEVASAHRGLSIQYSNRARSAFPQIEPAAVQPMPQAD